MDRKNKNFTVQDEIRRNRKMRQARQLRHARSRMQRALAVILCLVVFLFLVLTITVLVTRVQTVTVRGNDRYNDAELLEAADITGEILPLLRAEVVYDRIAAVCPYVDRVQLVKTYPSTVEIVVTETEAIYATQTHGRWLSLDAGLRVMDYLEDVSALITLRMPEVQSALEGSRLVFADAESDGYVAGMLAVFFPEERELFLTALDMTDRYALVGMVGDEAKILFGDYQDLDVKVKMAKEILSDARAESSARTLIDVSEPSRASAQYDYKGEF